MKGIRIGKANGNGPLHIIRGEVGALCGVRRAICTATLFYGYDGPPAKFCGKCVYVFGWATLVGDDSVTLENLPKVQLR